MKKSITKNYIYNLTYQILVLILPLITTPYISRVLGAENIGIYSYTLSISAYFILFGSLGVALYGQREIAYNQENKNKIQQHQYTQKNSLFPTFHQITFTLVSGERFLKISVTLILASSEAKALSRKTARRQIWIWDIMRDLLMKT